MYRYNDNSLLYNNKVKHFIQGLVESTEYTGNVQIGCETGVSSAVLKSHNGNEIVSI